MTPDQKSQPGNGLDQLKRTLRPVLMLLALAFVAWTGFQLVRRWDGRAVSLEPGLVAAALLPVVVSGLFQALAWILLVERMAGARTPRLAAFSLYLDSQLARYTPGKVGLPLVRMEGAPRLGLGRGLVGVSVLIETLSWLGTGAALGFLVLSVVSVPATGLLRLVGQLALPLLGLSLLAVLALVTVDRRRYPDRLSRLLGSDRTGPYAPPLILLVHFAYWACWVLHGYLLARAFGALSEPALGAMGFCPLANVLGFAALAAPAGVGVREAVLISGFSPGLGAAAALSVALVSRAESLASDVGLWLLVRLVQARRSR